MDIRVCTLCSGYDSQMMALRRVPNLNVDLVYWSEIDDNAITAHNAIFPEYADRNLGDMTKIDWGQCEDFDLLTYSTPCQSVSNAGNKEKGMEKGSGTRSSIIWSVEECIKIKHPRILIMENVKNIVSKRFKPFFDEWCRLLESYGYTNSWKVMNAKDNGVRQNRERLIMVSLLDNKTPFVFPESTGFKNSLNDILESNLDDKLYIEKDVISPFITDELTKLLDDDKTKYLQCKTLNGNISRRILFWSRDAKGKVLRRIPREISPCITSFSCSQFYTQTIIVMEYEGNFDLTNLAQLKGVNYRIRFLTPRECFRLMDVSDENIDKIFDAGCKKLILLAGNSIVVSVLERVFEKLFADIEKGSEN